MGEHYTTMVNMIFFGFLLFWSVSATANIKVAITVDDLPAHAKVPTRVSYFDVAKKMLAVFKSNDIPEVYGFINAGKMAKDSSLLEVLKLWRSAGYPLGNHTYSHPNLNTIAVKDFENDIDANEPALMSLAGDTNWKVFRYPFLIEGNNLEKREAVRDHLQRRGYKIAQVTVDFEDWSWNNPYVRCLEKGDAKAIKWLRSTYIKNATDMLVRADKITNFLFKKSVKHILLLHMGVFDAEMLPTLLKAYRSKGVEFIPLNDAMKDEIYAHDPKATFERGSEFTYQVMKSRGVNLKDVGLEPYKDYSLEALEKLCL